MSLRPLAVLSLALPFLCAQAPHATNDAAPPIVVSQGAGLQVDPEGGLVGGAGGYAVRFTAAGMRFEPALGRTVEQTHHLSLAARSLRRGGDDLLALPSLVEPVLADLAAVYEHGPTIHERFDVRTSCVELSWRFAQPLPGSGDLVVTYDLGTSLPAATSPSRTGGIAFTLPNGSGVAIGGVTGIDARGTKVAGGLHYADGVLSLSLPGEFLARAVYPVVLDPAIGNPVAVTPFSDSGEPDLCYNAINATFLAVWEEEFSATDVRIRGQRLLSNGNLLGSMIVFSSSGVAVQPRVANLRMLSRWAVVWTQQSGSTSSLRLQTVSAGSGTITHSLLLNSSTSATFHDADVAGEVTTSPGSVHDLAIVYRDTGLAAIRKRHVFFDSNDAIHGGTVVTLWANDTTLSTSFSQPEMSRAAGANGALLVVARRLFGVNQNASIRACRVQISGSSVGPYATLTSATAPSDVLDPDVDGIGDRWIVTYRATGTTPLGLSQRIDYDAAMNTLGASPSELMFSLTSTPSVAYGPGLTWVGHYLNGYNGVKDFKLFCVDTASGAYCNDFILGTVTPSFQPWVISTRIVAAGGTSSGSPQLETGLVVWSQPVFNSSATQVGHEVRVQQIRSHGSGGTTTDLGGACGNGGTQSFVQPPALGTNNFECDVDGLPAGALLTIFNLAPVGAPIPCGACSWTPFAVTLTPPIVAGAARVEFPIPCVSQLNGAELETQWTTIHPAQAPCPLVPGFVMSNRVKLTIH